MWLRVINFSEIHANIGTLFEPLYAIIVMCQCGEKDEVGEDDGRVRCHHYYMWRDEQDG